jgi:hypothetical protein
MQRLWMWTFAAVLLALACVACSEEEASQLLTVAPTLLAPTPSATVGPPVVIEARVRAVSSLTNMIAIHPVRGFKFIVIDAATTLVGPGETPLALDQVRVDDVLTVSGPPVGDGDTILATRIAVRPALAPRARGEAPEPGDQVIVRFFQRVDRGDVETALRALSPAALVLRPLEAWHAGLRAISEVRLLSVAQINQATWTPNWQEYLVTARVVARSGSLWPSGLHTWYIDLVRGSSGPWTILEVRTEPGLPVHVMRLEGVLRSVDTSANVLTMQLASQDLLTVTLAAQTKIVSADGFALKVGELEPGRVVTVEGLPTVNGGLIPDRVTLAPPPGLPTVAVEPATGRVGQTVHLLGRDWPPGIALKVYITVPTATFRPEPVAEGVAQADGAFDLALTIPDQWPDGKPVTERVLTIVVSTADFRAKARAEFAVVDGEP